MSKRSAIPSVEAQDEARDAPRVIRQIAVIALAAILLGLVMQGLILAGRLAGGGDVSQVRLVIDIAQGVTWSLFVCLGIGIATLLTKARAVIAGLLSMLFAPVALAIARSSQKVVASMIGAAESPAVLSVGAISMLKAVEYGLLGWLLALLVQNNVVRASPYLGSGAAVGVLFGGAIVFLSHQVAQAGGIAMGRPQLIGMTVNEVVFPIGCATVVYIGRIVSQSLGTLDRNA